MPSGLIYHNQELAKQKRTNSEALNDFKDGIVDKINLELKLDEKFLPHDLKQFHQRLIAKHNFEDFEVRQMRENRRLNRLKRRLGRIALGRKRRTTNNTGSSSFMLGGNNFSRKSRSSYTNNFGNNISKSSFQSESSSLQGGGTDIKLYSGNKPMASLLNSSKRRGNLNTSGFQNSLIQSSFNKKHGRSRTTMRSKEKISLSKGPNKRSRTLTRSKRSTAGKENSGVQQPSTIRRRR